MMSKVNEIMVSEILLVFTYILLNVSNSDSLKQNENKFLEFPAEIFVTDKFLTVPLRNIQVNINRTVLILKFEPQNIEYCQFNVNIGGRNCTCIDTCVQQQFNCSISIESGPIRVITSSLGETKCEMETLKLKLLKRNTDRSNSSENVNSASEFGQCIKDNTVAWKSKCVQERGLSTAGQYTTNAVTSEPKSNDVTTKLTDELYTTDSVTNVAVTEIPSLVTEALNATTQIKEESLENITTTINVGTPDRTAKMIMTSSEAALKTTDMTTTPCLTNTPTDSTSEVSYHNKSTGITTANYKTIERSPGTDKRGEPNMKLALGITIGLFSVGVFVMVFLIGRVLYKTRKLSECDTDDPYQTRYEDTSFYVHTSTTSMNPSFVHIRKISESNTDDETSESQKSTPETDKRQSGRYWERSDISRDCYGGRCGECSSFCSENNCFKLARPGRRETMNVTYQGQDIRKDIYAVSYKKKEDKCNV